jgi:hypothetical protein
MKNRTLRTAHRAGRGLLALSAAAVLLNISACKDASVDPPAPGGNTTNTTGELSFRQDILPIFTRNGCTGCHGGSSGLSVGTVNALMVGGDHGPAITPGDGANSLLIKKVSATPPFGSRMPLGGTPLADTTIGTIKRWINEGAKDN